MMRRIVLAGLFLSVIAIPRAGAHCDSMKGPVITTAQAALEKGDVTPLLKWIPAADEPEIRDAFAKTLAARAASPAAREVADRWFLETVVRVHRRAEGEPFTGIEGADYKAEEGIELADAAIDSGSLDAVQQQLSTRISRRFAVVMEAKKHANESVDLGRHYVHAYVEFIHYVEKVMASSP